MIYEVKTAKAGSDGEYVIGHFEGNVKDILIRCADQAYGYLSIERITTTPVSHEEVKDINVEVYAEADVITELVNESKKVGMSYKISESSVDISFPPQHIDIDKLMNKAYITYNSGEHTTLESAIKNALKEMDVQMYHKMKSCGMLDDEYPNAFTLLNAINEFDVE